MSDTVKLVIEIPKELYGACKEYADERSEDDALFLELIAIAHGIPLDSVIEEYVERGAINENMIMLDKIDSIKAEIKEWYWQADKQALAKDPCVVDAMVDLFIRTIDKHLAGMNGNAHDISVDSIEEEQVIKKNLFAIASDLLSEVEGYEQAIEDIKAEITAYKDDKIIHFESNCMIDIVLDIIDKHMREAQNADT